MCSHWLGWNVCTLREWTEISCDQWCCSVVGSSPCTHHWGAQSIARNLHFDTIIFKTFYIFFMPFFFFFFGMNLWSNCRLCECIVGEYLFILAAQCFLGGGGLQFCPKMALWQQPLSLWTMGQGGCPCQSGSLPAQFLHENTVTGVSTCDLRYCDCIALTLHSFQTDFNLSLWFKKKW